MGMGVIEAGHDCAPAEPNAAGGASGEPAHLGSRPNGNNAVAPDRHGLSPRVERIGGEDLAAGEN